MNAGLQKCFEALERIKANKPIVSKFINLPRNKVTAAVVSQEAGFDSGYLKKNRSQHQEIISLIESFKHEDGGSTLSVREKIDREKRKTDRLQAKLDQVENKLNMALAREILLLDQIDRMEQELAKYGVKV